MPFKNVVFPNDLSNMMGYKMNNHKYIHRHGLSFCIKYKIIWGWFKQNVCFKQTHRVLKRLTRDSAVTQILNVWYIYLLEWLICMVNVGKYTSPMDPMGQTWTLWDRHGPYGIEICFSVFFSSRDLPVSFWRSASNSKWLGGWKYPP